MRARCFEPPCGSRDPCVLPGCKAPLASLACAVTGLRGGLWWGVPASDGSSEAAWVQRTALTALQRLARRDSGWYYPHSHEIPRRKTGDPKKKSVSERTVGRAV